MSRLHACPGPGCKREVEYDKLACPRHWYQVSAKTRRRVWDAWAGGAGAGSDEHADAIRAAAAEMKP